ncbi:MAG TPA: type I methionyl aminopeptidase [Candidatus Paceibacterota bacterium]|nr:type I methionyl aminopeptidase [Candidatus Paceibacterota bacterium]
MIAKKKSEIDALREGCRRTARHLRILCEMVQPGRTSYELEMHARAMVEKDGDTLAFYGYADRKTDPPYESGLCCSVNDVIVHSPAGQNNVRFQDGDVVSLDFGIIHKGFYSDCARTVIAGAKRDPEDVKLVQGTYEAAEAGIKAAMVGNTVGDIGWAVEQIADKYGFGYPRNLCGHGVGRALHEDPRIPNYGEPGAGTKLVEGLVIAIEPMMTLGEGELFVDKDGHSYRTKDGSRSAHVENTLIVTKNGPEVLTKE